MRIADISFSDWLPDLPSFKNVGLEVADNVRPSTIGFRPFEAPVATDDEVSSDVRGANLFFNSNGANIIVGGYSDGLFIRNSSGITETTGLADIGADENWDFAQFNDFIVATAENNPPQYLDDIDTDTSFSALTGSPPSAKRCARVGEFLVMGNVNGTPNRVQWSHYNSPTSSWAASRLTQAGFSDFPKHFGDVQRIVGGRYALVFQERGISRLSYVGPPTVWNRATISEDRGTHAPFSVVTAGYFTFFLAQDGFFVTNGSSIDPISSQRVSRWFFANLNQDKIAGVQASVDWQNESVIWAFAGAGSETRNRLLIYNWSLQRWSTATVDVDWIVSTTLDQVSIDDLDAEYGNLDDIPVSLDSEFFTAKSSNLAAFISDGSTSTYNTFTGLPLPATMETGEFQPLVGRRVFVTQVTPILEDGDNDATITLLPRDNHNVKSDTQSAQVGWSGFAPIRAEGQKMALRLEKADSGWDNITGVQVGYRLAGSR